MTGHVGTMLRVCPLVLPLALLPSMAAQAQESVRTAAIQAVTAKLKPSMAYVPNLTADCRNSLREDILGLKSAVGEKTAAPANHLMVYDVFPLLYDIAGGTIRSMTVTLDDDPHWIVIVDDRDNHAFLLSGFPEAVSTPAFNDLVGILSLNLRTDDDVQQIFDFYLKFVKGNRYRSSIPVDQLSLQEIAAQDFRRRISASKASAQFRIWWTQHAAMRTTIRAPSVEEQSGRFTVRYFLYESGDVLRKQVSFRPDGRLAIQ